MIRRTPLPLLVLAFAAACESPSTAPEALRPGAATLNAHAANPGHACTGLEYDGTFQDVVVPAGESCLLAFGTVSGSVTVLEGASIYSVETRVAGNVVSRNASSVDLSGTVVGGDVVFEGEAGTGGRMPSHLIAGATLTHGDIRVMRNSGITVNLRDNDVLEGNIWVQNNEDTYVTLIANRVGGDVHVVGNRGEASTMVRSTSARRTIRCDANTTPFSAAENDAPVMQGQCAREAEVE